MINCYHVFNSRLVPAKEISEFKQHGLIENVQTEAWWEKIERMEQNVRDMWDTVKWSNVSVTRVPKEKMGKKKN